MRFLKRYDIENRAGVNVFYPSDKFVKGKFEN